MLLQIGQIMHTTPKPWKVDGSMAGNMLAPVLFAMLIVLASFILLAIYLVLQVRCLAYDVLQTLQACYSPCLADTFSSLVTMCLKEFVKLLLCHGCSMRYSAGHAKIAVDLWHF